ncbi:MAG: hypothetical protein WHS45_08065 [Anaerolinea sp.]
MKIFWEKWGLGLIVLGVIIAVLQSTHPGLAVTVPQGDSCYILEGEIREFYNSIPDASFILGEPITNLFDNPLKPSEKIQYFTRARIEFSPDLPAGQRVRLSPLGSLNFENLPPAELPLSPGACRTFPNDKSVCFDFLKFYDRYGGQKVFGLPISNLLKLPNNRLVQYFENARFEWWPERPEGLRVSLTELGRVDFDRNKFPRTLQDCHVPGNIIEAPIKPRVMVFPAKIAIKSSEIQTIYIIVRDQYRNPLENVPVSLQVVVDGKSTDPMRLKETDSSGLTQGAIPLGSYKPGTKVEVVVTVVVQEKTTTTRASFRIWW